MSQNQKTAGTPESGVSPDIPLPLEVRVHGRGGQGGVTCAKIVATIYAELGFNVQTFGDYGAERAGAPVRAFTRVDRSVITNRNKVYTPDHLIVLDPALMEVDALDGVEPGKLLVLNTAEEMSAYKGRYEGLRLAVVDATTIARKHGIGTSAVVIINTTVAGAYAKAMGLPMASLEAAYTHLGLKKDFKAAKEAYDTTTVREPATNFIAEKKAASTALAEVIELTAHTKDIPSPLKTGSWRTQMPRYHETAAPCNAACPAGNDIVGFIQTLKNLGPVEAAKILMKTQALPSVCGRVCPAPCINACNRGTYDGSINIRGLERWIGDHCGREKQEPETPARKRKIAVAGGGPAGLSAAFTLAKEGHSVTIHEKEPKLGGLLRTGIPSYRLPHEALDRDIDRIISLGVAAQCGKTLDAGLISALAEQNDAVIIATGLMSQRTLDCPGSGLNGIEQGIRFLGKVKNDAVPALRGHVVVAGGGNTAVDCARTALRCGAASVTIAYRRGMEEMPAIPEEIEDAVAEGVKIMPHRQPVAILGQERVEGIELAIVEAGEPDKSGRPRPVITGRTEKIPCDMLLLALGQEPDLNLLPRDWTIKEGRAFNGETPLNVWFAGDISTGDGTVTHAVGSGRRTAKRLLANLETGLDVHLEKPVDPSEIVSPAHVRFTHFEASEPEKELHLPVPQRLAGFTEVNLGLAGAGEAERCFSCGSCTGCDTCLVYCPEGIIFRESTGYRIDEDYCKGCGICVAECPRQAMEMTADGRGR